MAFFSIVGWHLLESLKIQQFSLALQPHLHAFIVLFVQTNI